MTPFTVHSTPMGVSVEDRVNIAETMARFSAGIDTRDWVLYRSVFTEHIDIDYRSWRVESYGPMSARKRLPFFGSQEKRCGLRRPYA